jgi:hypothetical protein
MQIDYVNLDESVYDVESGETITPSIIPERSEWYYSSRRGETLLIPEETVVTRTVSNIAFVVFGIVYISYVVISNVPPL